MYQDLWQYVMSFNPFLKEDDVEELIEINEWDLLIVLKTGEKVLYDRFTKYYRVLSYNGQELTEEQEIREFKTNLRNMMARKFISQEMLAREIGTSQQMISRYLSGTAMPSALVLRKIARTLNCSIDDLFYKHY